MIVAGKLGESVFWDMVSDDEMPPEPEEPLSADEKRMLRRWIEQGARDLPAITDVRNASPAADHWAFALTATPTASLRE